MKVYVLVKDFDEGDFGGSPEISTWTFSTLDAAKKAMQEEIEQFKNTREVDWDSLDETDTSFFCLADEYHQYGECPQLILEIHENEVW